MMRERRALQAVVGVACLIPILIGIEGVLRGAAIVAIVPIIMPNIASAAR